ncbi:MAG: DUF1295 domain-containing protein, partial [Myxococcales bacterium]|nr:DUF1295 domain-containing protein [Myxococcales bacterium]
LPAVLFTRELFAVADPASVAVPRSLFAIELYLSLDGWRAIALHHPILYVNLVFFLNVCVLFWLLSLIQRSTWLIDPYWTIIPLLVAHFYAAHPFATANGWRSGVSLALLWAWSLRLTYNYLRREAYRFGAREDWRFAEKRRSSRHFWWYSFFYAYLSQQVMLVGLTLPFYVIHRDARPFGLFDVLFAVAGLAGIVIAHIADTTLYTFMEENRQRIARGEPKVQILERGIWRYSRHPNYFGEQLFWWAIGAIGAALGQPLVLAGTAFNSVVLAVVTVMTERRIAAAPGRREDWARYRAQTSALIPWFRQR